MGTTNYITANGMLIGESTGGVNRAYGLDALGSVVATYTGTSVENAYVYKPYGGVLAKTGPATDPSFLWNGGSGYRATSLSNSEFYVHLRHFSASSAQWTTCDPIWPSEPAYAYTNASPALLADSSGLAGGPPTSSTGASLTCPKGYVPNGTCSGGWNTIIATGSCSVGKKSTSSACSIVCSALSNKQKNRGQGANCPKKCPSPDIVIACISVTDYLNDTREYFFLTWEGQLARLSPGAWEESATVNALKPSRTGPRIVNVVVQPPSHATPASCSPGGLRIFSRNFVRENNVYKIFTT